MANASPLNRLFIDAGGGGRRTLRGFLSWMREMKYWIPERNLLYSEEKILSKLAAKGFSNEMFKRSFERWTQLFSCMNGFTRRALNFPYFEQSLQILFGKICMIEPKFRNRESGRPIVH